MEILGEKYGVKIIFCPRYHCELNVCEGLWCSMKLFVRRHTDQTYSKMLQLITESRKNFHDKRIYLKLVRRFWRTVAAYDAGQSYVDVMKMFFSAKCEGTVVSHTRISNSRLDD